MYCKLQRWKALPIYTCMLTCTIYSERALWWELHGHSLLVRLCNPQSRMQLEIHAGHALIPSGPRCRRSHWPPAENPLPSSLDSDGKSDRNEEKPALRDAFLRIRERGCLRAAGHHCERDRPTATWLVRYFFSPPFLYPFRRACVQIPPPSDRGVFTQ